MEKKHTVTLTEKDIAIMQDIRKAAARSIRGIIPNAVEVAVYRDRLNLFDAILDTIIES